MAAQSLMQRMTRTVFTLAAIGLTVGVIMALEGIVREVSGTLTEMAGEDIEIMIRQAGVADTEFSAIDKRVGGKIAALSEVRSVSGILFTAVVLPENNSFFIMLGYSPNEPAIRRFNIVEGSRIATNHQVMIGRAMSEALKRGVGDNIELGGSRFKVVGIYESSVSWEELGGVVTLRDAQTFAGRPNKVTMYAVDLMEPDRASEVVEKINRQFPEVHASLTGEFVEQMPDMANAGAMLNGISLLAILVGGVGILNTMLMSVLERTREIGVLRALGWRRLAILWMIMKEALFLGILGAISGIAIAYGLVFVSSKAPMIGEAFRAEFSWDVFARAITVAVSLGVIGGLYPAYRATRLQPVEALRYE
jgi:ABC-type antimicrobial peptide transport system permease subunit